MDAEKGLLTQVYEDFCRFLSIPSLIKSNIESNINVELDLPNQRVIKVDIYRTISQSAVFRESDKLIMETIITAYCKEKNMSYKQGMSDILAPFLFLVRQLNIIQHEELTVFRLFRAFFDRKLFNLYESDDFIPLQCLLVSFQLLLRFHDPQLEDFLTENNVSTELYASSWFLTLFSRCSSMTNTLKIFLELVSPRSLSICFLSLAILLENRAFLFNLDVDEFPGEVNKLLDTDHPNKLTLTCSENIDNLFEISRNLEAITPLLFYNFENNCLKQEKAPTEKVLDYMEEQVVCMCTLKQVLLTFDIPDILFISTSPVEKLTSVDLLVLADVNENILQDLCGFSGKHCLLLFGERDEETVYIAEELLQFNISKLVILKDKFASLVSFFQVKEQEIMTLESITTNSHETSLFTQHSVLKQKVNINKEEFEWMNLNEISSSREEFHGISLFIVNRIIDKELKTKRAILGITEDEFVILDCHPEKKNFAKLTEILELKNLTKISTKAKRSDILIFHFKAGNQQLLRKRSFSILRSEECINLIKTKKKHLKR